jgi:hypothetical protein
MRQSFEQKWYVLPSYDSDGDDSGSTCMPQTGQRSDSAMGLLLVE